MNIRYPLGAVAAAMAAAVAAASAAPGSAAAAEPQPAVSDVKITSGEIVNWLGTLAAFQAQVTCPAGTRIAVSSGSLTQSSGAKLTQSVFGSVLRCTGKPAPYTIRIERNVDDPCIQLKPGPATLTATFVRGVPTRSKVTKTFDVNLAKGALKDGTTACP